MSAQFSSNLAAINLASAMQRLAVARFQRRTIGVKHTLSDEAVTCVSEPVIGGILHCMASVATNSKGAKLNYQDAQLYQTRFEFRGKVISRVDAERLLNGQPIEVAA